MASPLAMASTISVLASMPHTPTLPFRPAASSALRAPVAILSLAHQMPPPRRGGVLGQPGF